jgi:leucyl aminopeptidase (aminopeptidase T)
MSHIVFAELGNKVIKMLANAQAGEKVLVLGDTASNSAMLEAFFAAAINAGCETGLLIYKERPHINFEPPAYIAEAMKGADVLVDLSTNYMIHTEAYNNARLSGTRALVTIPPGIEEYIRRGIIGIDYLQMVQQGKKIAELFESSKTCKITSEEGTSIEMEMGSRPAILRDGMVVKPGEIDYFPGAQVSFAPLEETLNGHMVVNGAISPPIGKLTQTVEIRFEKGRIVDFKGHAEAYQWKEWLESQEDPKMFCIAHVSIGLNPNAQLRGFIIEDERVEGCVTFGIGSQMPDFKGKTGKAKTHTDAVSVMATVTLDDKTIVNKGKMTI